jgi:hypothetical protein
MNIMLDFWKDCPFIRLSEIDKRMTRESPFCIIFRHYLTMADWLKIFGLFQTYFRQFFYLTKVLT